MAAILSAAASLDWWCACSSRTTPNGARELLAAAAKVPAGSDGLLFLPTCGPSERAHFDPAARGALVGMRIGHRPRGGDQGLVLEGSGLCPAEGLDLMRGVGVEPTSAWSPARGVNRLWQQIIADMLNMPIALGATEHASARGAALLGAVAAGIAPSTARSTWPLPVDTRVMEPIPTNVENSTPSDPPPTASCTPACPGSEGRVRGGRPPG